MNYKHSFHIVDISPWPLINSFNLMNLLVSFCFYMKNINSIKMSLICLFLLNFTLLIWWRDVIRESSFQGHHTFNVFTGLKISMLLFILSEIMFFSSFFWSFFHISLTPDLEMNFNWPPISIQLINPYHLPLLNTNLLLSSGVTITWAHYSILNKNYNTMMFSLAMTIFLGMIFSIFQFMEYNNMEFSINDSSFSSIFLMSTGFHGLHVLIGTIFLTICFLRMIKNQFNNLHHFNFEAASWYWHFVDVVWIYLYTFMYWWFF